MADDEVDADDDTAAPTQCSRPMRSRPSAAEITAIATGVAPMMSAAFETLVSRDAADEADLVAEVADEAEPQQIPAVAPASAVRRVERPRRVPAERARATARDADGGEEHDRRELMRSALNGCGGISLKARLMTL